MPIPVKDLRDRPSIRRKTRPSAVWVDSHRKLSIMLLRMAALLVTLMASAAAFRTPSISSRASTSLSAVPPLIIGPMIKKMREGQEQKRMPLADPSEAANEAPGLRVGKGAWKWPSVWPYDRSFFLPSVEAAAIQQKAQMSNVASMLSGVAQVPTEEKVDESTKLDPLEYWPKQEKSYHIDPEAADKLRQHFGYYLRDGMSILEFGAGEDSYLPSDLRTSRHVGVSADLATMNKNPRLSERLVVDLNKVIEERDVDSDELRRLAAEPFDAVIMTDTVGFLSSPREVFRSAWYLLKPGGIMMVAFSSKEFTKSSFSDAQTAAWKQYNDDQHMWITGSFFQFSAGDGWDSLKGFDISPESAKSVDDAGPLAILKKGKNNNMFVVQAFKAYQDDAIDPSNPERSIRSLTWMLPTLESRDKDLVVPRLARAYSMAQADEIRAAIERNIEHLPTIYEALIKMDQFAFTFNMQAQMAADLCSNPKFEGSKEQMQALKEGLGLRTPGKDFWLPIGQQTAAMAVEDKINLLAYIVPCFGSGDPAQEEALQAFVSGLQPTYAVIRSKCPDLSESDVQLLGTELLAAEVLPVGQSNREEYAQWLAAMSEKELQGILEERKSFQIMAKEELANYKKQLEEEKEAREAYKRIMDEQVELARKERSLIFNPRTQKMEVYDNPNKKK